MAVSNGEAAGSDLQPVIGRAAPLAPPDESAWQRPERIWTSPLQHMEDTATYDRRYVGRLVAPKVWSPQLGGTMLPHGSHVPERPEPWTPRVGVSGEMRTRLAPHRVLSENAAPSSRDAAADLEAEAAQWEAEAALNAMRAKAAAERAAYEAEEVAYNDWWGEYERGREETIVRKRAQREAELEAEEEASIEREREERRVAEALRVELEQRRAKLKLETARVDKMLAAQKLEMDRIRSDKEAAAKRAAAEKVAQRNAKASGGKPAPPT